MGEAGRREKDEGGDVETCRKEIRVNKFCGAAKRASVLGRSSVPRNLDHGDTEVASSRFRISKDNHQRTGGTTNNDRHPLFLGRETSCVIGIVSEGCKIFTEEDDSSETVKETQVESNW